MSCESTMYGRTLRCVSTSLVIGTALLTLGPIARAEQATPAVDDASRSAARQLGTDGVKAYQAGDYDLAIERLERAFKVLPAPSLGLWSARALEKGGKLVQAAERYLTTTRLPPAAGGDKDVQEQAKRDAAAEREALLPKIPGLVIEVEGASEDEVSLTVDDAPVNSALIGTPLPANPGTVTVVAESGEARAQLSVTLAVGETKTVTLNLAAGPTTAAPAESAIAADDSQRDAGSEQQGPRWQPIVGWSALGVGVAGLALGGIAAGLAVAQYDTAAAGCTNNVCPPGTQPSQIQGYNELLTVSSIGIIAGGVLAGAGLTLLLLTPKQAESGRQITPYLGVASLGVRGTF